jgi:SAM-dependent methyltransferase
MAGMPRSSWIDGRDYFDTVASLYDSRRPEFPPQVFAEAAAIAGLTPGSRVLEVGPGTGQATLRLAELGLSVVALEPGEALADLAEERLRDYPSVEVVRSRFEDWEPGSQRFDAVVSASSWHWIDPAVRWQKAHDLLVPSGWLVLVAHIVVRQPGEREVYGETADLHEAHASGHPSWGHPPTEEQIVTEAGTASGNIVELERVLGRAVDASPTEGLFDVPVVRWFRQVQHLDARGYVELKRTMSVYGTLDPDTREPLLGAMEDHIRERMDDEATRRYLIAVRTAQRSG